MRMWNFDCHVCLRLSFNAWKKTHKATTTSWYHQVTENLVTSVPNLNRCLDSNPNRQPPRLLRDPFQVSQWPLCGPKLLMQRPGQLPGQQRRGALPHNGRWVTDNNKNTEPAVSFHASDGLPAAGQSLKHALYIICTAGWWTVILNLLELWQNERRNLFVIMMFSDMTESSSVWVVAMLGSYCIAYLFFFQPLEASYLRLQHKMDRKWSVVTWLAALLAFVLFKKYLSVNACSKRKIEGLLMEWRGDDHDFKSWVTVKSSQLPANVAQTRRVSLRGTAVRESWVVC